MSFIRIFEHILPKARAWRLAAGKQLKEFFEGLADLPADIRNYIDLVWLDIFPSTTRELDEWETTWALPDTGLTEQERRDRLDATWKAIGGQDPRYIQDTLQAAGFGVYIHEWWAPGTEPVLNVHSCTTPRNPLVYLAQPGAPINTFLIACGEPVAQCGEAQAQCSELYENPEGYALVNKVTSTVKKFLALCGEPGAECGEPTIQCGAYESLIFQQKEYFIPTDPAKWPYFVYFSAENFPDFATVPKPRRDEFEDLCLKICPLHLWIGILVKYIAFTALWDTENGGSPSKTIVLPIVAGIYTVNWGDGTINNLNTHEYAAGGVKEIMITGVGPVSGFTFNNGGDKLKLVDVTDASGINIDALETFRGCSNMVWSATNKPHVVTSLTLTFQGASLFDGDVNSWDVSQVQYALYCFADTGFNQPLNLWDVGEVIDITQMFARNGSFNQNINSWDTSKLEVAFGALADCTAYEQPMGGWDVSGVTDTRYMFAACTVFTGVGLEVWDVGSVVTMSAMFSSTDAFNRDIGAWDVRNVTSMESMFRNATAFNQSVNAWVLDSCTDTSFMFAGALSYSKPMDLLDVSQVTTFESMFEGSAFDQDIGAWDFSSATSLVNMLNYCSMSTANYDALLTSLDAQAASLTPGLVLGVQNLTYTAAGAGGTARTNLGGAPAFMTFVGDSGV